MLHKDVPSTHEASTPSEHSSASGTIDGEQSLSTHEFYEAIWSAEPKIAVFDCDGTLWSPDAGSGFMDWTIQTSLLSRDAARWLTDRHAEYDRGLVDEETMCGEMTSIYAGIAETDLRASARAYFNEHIEPYIFPEMVSVMQEMQAAGVEIWAVSSTNHWMIEEALAGLGVGREKIMAACVHINDGIATDKIRNVPTGPLKATSLRAAGIDRPDVVFGNSVHDAAMLEMARRAFPVNPSAGLQKLAVERGWPVYYPAAIRTR